jgi:hypothetical protein
VRWVAVCALGFALGCGGSGVTNPDASARDLGVTIDAGMADTGVFPDAMVMGADAAGDEGLPDVAAMDAGTSTVTPDAGPSCPARCDRTNGNADCTPCGGICMLDMYNSMGHFGMCVF